MPGFASCLRVFAFSVQAKIFEHRRSLKLKDAGTVESVGVLVNWRYDGHNMLCELRDDGDGSKGSHVHILLHLPDGMTLRVAPGDGCGARAA